jgi:hypothetical protein
MNYRFKDTKILRLTEKIKSTKNIAQQSWIGISNPASGKELLTTELHGKQEGIDTDFKLIRLRRN